MIFAMSSSYSDTMDYARGRAGTALKNSFRIHCAPEKYDPDYNENLPAIYSEDDGRSLDLISNIYTPKSQLCIIPIVPPKWMEISPYESSKIALDLHNLALTETNIAVDRGSLPFATVSKVTAKHGNITIGYSTFRNDIIQAVEPEDQSKGNIARIIFYVSTIYPVALWTDWGNFFLENNPYPTLNSDAIELYLNWHRNDPVDEDELNRCMKVKNIQGNINPFVTNPELAEYLWGDKVGEIYGMESSIVTESLKAVYSKSSDTHINLDTPYLPEDTKWWIDQQKVSGSITTSSLSEGTHELKFATQYSSGKLLINVTE